MCPTLGTHSVLPWAFCGGCVSATALGNWLSGRHIVLQEVKRVTLVVACCGLVPFICVLGALGQDLCQPYANAMALGSMIVGEYRHGNGGDVARCGIWGSVHGAPLEWYIHAPNDILTWTNYLRIQAAILNLPHP